MENIIYVNWLPEENKTQISFADRSYSVELIINMLVSGLCSLVQACSENKAKFKDWEMMHRIKTGIDILKFPESDQKLTVIVRANYDEHRVNIAFPEKQGFLPIDLTIDILTMSLYPILNDDRHDESEIERIKVSVLSILNSNFINANADPIVIENHFLNK